MSDMSPDARRMVEVITVTLYAGVVLTILLCAAALVARAWGLL